MSWRNRNRQAPKQRVLSTPKDSHKPIKIPSLTKLEEQVDHLATMLRGAKPQWNSVQQVRRSFRCLLSFNALWLQTRTIFLATRTEVVDAVRELNHPYEYGNTMHRSHGDNECIVYAASLQIKCRGYQETQQVVTAANRFDTLAAELHNLYKQTEQDFYHQLPAWSDLKKRKVCPLRGRDIYSVLLACIYVGKTVKELNYEHKLFGWHSVQQDNILESLQYAKGLLIPLWESHGDAPSKTRGMKLLDRLHRESYGYRQKWAAREATSKIARVSRLQDFISRYQAGYFGRGVTQSPTLVLASKNFGWQYNYVNRFLEKLQVDRAVVNPGCILAGKPTRVGNTQDYYVPAVWMKDKTITAQEEAPKIHKTIAIPVFGNLLLRVGWPDVYHAEPDFELTPENIHRQLDLSTTHYFAAKRNQLESQASAALKDQHQKRKLALALWAVRQVPTVTLKDSYEVGNCVPGTAAFCKNLGITSQAISGRELAVRWRKAKFIEQSRFLPIVEKINAKYKQAMEQAQQELAAQIKAEQMQLAKENYAEVVVIMQDNIIEAEQIVQPDVLPEAVPLTVPEDTMQFIQQAVDEFIPPAIEEVTEVVTEEISVGEAA